LPDQADPPDPFQPAPTPGSKGWRDPATGYYHAPDMAYENWPRQGVLGWIRLGLRALAMVFAFLVCVPLYYVWRILHLPNPWPRLFLRAAARCCGARVRRVGVNVKRDVVFIANHLSWVDIPIMGGRSGSAFVAKAEIGKWPFIGWLCKLNNTVFVSRSDRMGIAEQINEVRDALYETWSITIFPEGTTTDGSMMLPFKSPLLKVLDPPPPGVLVQPIFIDFHDMAHNVAWIGEETAQLNAWRLLSRAGSFPVTVNFLDPFDPHDFPGRKAVAAEARRRIAEAMSESLGYTVE